MAQTNVSPPSPAAESTERNPLVAIVSAVVGAILIIISAVFSPDSISHTGPTVGTIVLRVALMGTCFATYAGVMLYYSKRNAAFRAHLEESMNSNGKKKKKGK